MSEEYNMALSSCLVAASLLSADFARIAEGVRLAEESGADWIHMDVMDGSFVPNITFGPKMVEDVRKLTSLPLDVHLMIVNPDRHADMFMDAGADHLTVHLEASVHVHRLLASIRERGVRAGISIVPSTPAESISEIADLIDIVLVMSVNPGFGGQKLIPRSLEKIRSLDAMRKRDGYGYLIAVDGGINRSTASDVRSAGADVLISGSAFYSSEDPSGEVRYYKGA